MTGFWFVAVMFFVMGVMAGMSIVWVVDERKKKLPERDHYKCSNCGFRLTTVNSIRCPSCDEVFVNVYDSPPRDEEETK